MGDATRSRKFTDRARFRSRFGPEAVIDGHRDERRSLGEALQVIVKKKKKGERIATA